MSARDPGWAWFDGVAEWAASAPGGAVEGADIDLARSFARCFRDRDGERVLAHLRAVTLDRALGPGAPDALLRHTEGQRQLVAYVIGLIDRGREAG